MSSDLELPEVDVLHRTLRRITERLIAEVQAPTTTPPDWDRLEWAIAHSVCAMQGISGLLANRLRWQAPPRFLAFLRDQREHTAAFRERAKQKLRDIDGAAREAGVPFIALKGAAAFDLDLHGRGERPISDLDLLVDPSDVEAMRAVLESCGYVHSHTARRHIVFDPVAGTRFFGYADHRDNPLRVELHTRITESLPVNAIEITPTLWPATRVAGMNPYASRAAQFRHLLSHAAGNMRAHAFRGIQAFDIAAFAVTLDASDWRELFEDARAPAWWIYPPLALAARIRPGSIPDAALGRAARACPRWLRSRARRVGIFEVSWSNVRIAALPGIEWSRTPLEVLRLVRTRLLPNRAELSELKENIESLPRLLDLPWYQLSHSRRIVRWILGRAPRVQAMTSLAAACAEESRSAGATARE